MEMTIGEKPQLTQARCEPTSRTKFSETAFNSFRIFYYEIFSLAIKRVHKKFVPGKHFFRWATRLQAFPKTSTKSARKHAKSRMAMAFLAWKLFRNEHQYNEWLYFSYKQDLAAHQLKWLKRYIAALPEYFGDYEDLTDAAGKIHFKKNNREFIVEPEGILAFKRGRHPIGIICDDILKDPKSKLNITIIQQITTVFLEEIMSMPEEELHVWGTPQDKDDLFSELEKMPEFNAESYPAIISRSDRTVLWPEKFPFEKLEEMERNLGTKAFNKEFQCRPVRGEEGFFREEKLDKITWRRLKNYDFKSSPRLREWTFGGFDIGKKTHPSHLWLNGVDRKKRLVQLVSFWMEGWDYIDQIEFLRMVIKNFKVAKLFYDDTRSEFESFREAGTLPGEMEGIPFTAKSKFAMAADVDAMVTQGNIILLQEERQKRQLLSIDNDLKAIQTAEGHGDCFFSLCLAVKAYREGQGLGVFVI